MWYRLKLAVNTLQLFKTAGVNGILQVLLYKLQNEIQPQVILVNRSNLKLGYGNLHIESMPKSNQPFIILFENVGKASGNYITIDILERVPTHLFQHT